jgi:hypothetical protein
MKANQIITELLTLWYACIGPTHHKNRDCWYKISANCCTYSEFYWEFEHDGYILHSLPTRKKFKNFSDAEDHLITVLVYGIKRETDFAINATEDDWADLNKEKAEKIKAELHKVLGDNDLEKHLDFARELGEGLT